MDFLNKFDFTLLLGPANSGKTSYFLNLPDSNKLIIANVPIEKLAADKETLSNLQKCKFVNIATKIIDPEIWGKPFIVLIDEIHFLANFDYYIIETILNFNKRYIKHLYVALLTGSNLGKPFKPQADIISLANNIVMVPGKCALCGFETTRSRCFNGFRGEKQVNKFAYKACCFYHLDTHVENVESSAVPGAF